jgi:hypothetical protein
MDSDRAASAGAPSPGLAPKKPGGEVTRFDWLNGQGRCDSHLRGNRTSLSSTTPRIGQVVDLVGPLDALYLVWKARFHPPDRYTLDTEAITLRIRGRTMWMREWMWKLLVGTVTFSQVADSMQGDTVRIELLITHPLLGRIFATRAPSTRSARRSPRSGSRAADAGGVVRQFSRAPCRVQLPLEERKTSV